MKRKVKKTYSSANSPAIVKQESTEEILSRIPEILNNKDHAEMARLFKILADRQPNIAAFRINEGVAYHHLGQHELAEKTLLKANQIAPDNEHILKNLGQVYLSLQKNDLAVNVFNLALEKCTNSNDLTVLWNNLGLAYRRVEKMEKAVECFENVLSYGTFPDVMLNLANTYQDLNNSEKAIETLEKCLENFPQDTSTLMSLGKTYLHIGQSEEACNIYRQVKQLLPSSVNLTYDIGVALQYREGITPKELYDATKAIGIIQLSAPSTYGMDIKINKDPNKKLKIGFVSGDLRRHSVVFLVAGAIMNMTSDTYCYFVNIHEDEWTEKIKSKCTKFSKVGLLKSSELFQMIVDDEIDILIDLAGYTSYNKLDIFAGKPTPITCTWAGWVGTTGLSNMDYLIADKYEVPEGEDKYYTETVIRMPNDYISFMTHDNPPNVKQAPVVNNGFITFGSYNNIQKLNPTIVKAWTEILNKVENSKLIIKTHKAADQSVVKYFSDMFIDNGADISRISFVGESVEHFDALDYYNNFDISLDTTPYSSGVTCLECLFMGTPMVAITGNTFAGRHSTTHLMNAGLPELVASNLEEYIEKAVNLANNVDRIKEYKASLRNDLMKSPVMNHVQFANDLETEFRKMWVKYCAEN